MSEISERNILRAIGELFPLDSLLYVVVILLCFFSFNHPDILHTIGCTSAVLNGHIADFYSAITTTFVVSNYLPSTYVVFALWGLPLKLLGFFETVAYPEPAWLFFWFKILTSLFFAGSAVVLYKSCLESFKDQQRAMLACVLYVASPVAVFSQFVFGQYDIISVFFMMLGLLYYVRGDLLLFSFWFSISVGFKYFPAFIFFPLLALKEKNIKKLFLCCLIFAAPNLIQISLFLHSPAFVEGVLGFGAAKKALNKGLLFWPLICAYAYWVNYKTRESRDLYFYAKLSLFCFVWIFFHTPWHPQWLLILTPFIAILLAYAGNMKSLLLVDTLFALAFFSHTFRAFPAAVDTNLFGMGLWGLLDPAYAAAQNLYKLSSVGIYQLGSKKNLFHVIILCLIFLAFMSRKYGSGPESAGETSAPPYALIRLRFYGVMAVFLLSAFYAYYKTVAV